MKNTQLDQTLAVTIEVMATGRSVHMRRRVTQHSSGSSAVHRGFTDGVLITVDQDLDDGDLTMLAARMAQYVLAKHRYRGSVKRAVNWRDMDDARRAAPVPPAGGEGGEGLDELGTPPLPGLEGPATISTRPAPVVEDQSVGAKRPRQRTSKGAGSA